MKLSSKGNNSIKALRREKSLCLILLTEGSDSLLVLGGMIGSVPFGGAVFR